MRKSKKGPVNIMLSPKLRTMGDRLAVLDRRSLSEEIQWLIGKEAEARGFATKPK